MYIDENGQLQVSEPTEPSVIEGSEQVDHTEPLATDYAGYWDENGDYQLMPYSQVNPSAQGGYLSATMLDIYDRIVAGSDYRYYIAYRTTNNTYDGTMYLFDKFTDQGNSIKFEGKQITLYRSYSGNTYYYWYKIEDSGTVTVNTSMEYLLYTNAVEGYPILGGKKASAALQFTEYLPYLIVFILACILIVLRRRNR